VSWALSRRQTILASLYDAGCWALSIFVAEILRYQVVSDGTVQWGTAGLAIIFVITMQLGLGAIFFYRNRWRIGSFEEALTVAMVILAVGMCLGLLSVIAIRSAVSYGSVLAATAFCLVLALGGRAMYRLIALSSFRNPISATAERAIIFGAGVAGTQVIEALSAAGEPPFNPVALLDDDPNKRDLRIRNLKVLGGRDAIAEVAAKTRATILQIAITNADSSEILDLSNRARAVGLKVRVLPSITELFAGVVGLDDIRPLTLEDLMGRRQVDTSVDEIAHYLRGRRVLVTGAGGSIGSELCRHINRFEPAELIMLERDESALHQVQLSLEGRAMLDRRNLVVCDIRDAEALCRVFDEHRPEVVFHAAALKHLPLLQMWPAEAVKTNVWGTANVLDAAQRFGVETFVNISTDKAADPVSVLGYSKRLAERLTASYAELGSGRFISVRFGNVLGSRGSVLTAFRQQVEDGGPITVTDPEVTRYFMTIPEAVQLTLQAGALGENGEVLVLDMGNPVRIADVAQQLADEAPEPIEIVFTGLRDGEKLHEELFGYGEANARSVHPLIASCAVPVISAEACAALVVDAPPSTVRNALHDLCNDTKVRAAAN